MAGYGRCLGQAKELSAHSAKSPGKQLRTVGEDGGDPFAPSSQEYEFVSCAVPFGRQPRNRLQAMQRLGDQLQLTACKMGA